MLAYFEQHNLFVKIKFGFRPGSSTTRAITEIVNTLTTALEQGKLASVTLCDLSKAFDCVVHDVLLQKLNHYHISGKALSLIKSYLSGRTQFVELNSQKFTKQPIRYGISQGSILGQILFLIYANDLPKSIKEGKPFFLLVIPLLFLYLITQIYLSQQHKIYYIQQKNGSQAINLN